MDLSGSLVHRKIISRILMHMQSFGVKNAGVWLQPEIFIQRVLHRALESEMLTNLQDQLSNNSFADGVWDTLLKTL